MIGKDAGQLAEIKKKARDYIMYPWLWIGQIVMLYGYRGEGKTHFLTALALSAARGVNFLNGRNNYHYSVAYFDCEMGCYSMSQRLLAHYPNLKALGDRFRLISFEECQHGIMYNLSNPAHTAWYVDAIADSDIVIFDNLMGICRTNGRETEVQMWDRGPAVFVSTKGIRQNGNLCPPQQ
jgi:hypothetical protein